MVPITIERTEDHSVLRMEGECTVTSATEVKKLLVEGMASGADLRVDLEQATEVDISILQLLWAVGGAGGGCSVQPSQAVIQAARETGFTGFDWLPVEK